MDNRGNEIFFSSNSNVDVDVVFVDDGIIVIGIFNWGVDGRNIVYGKYGSMWESVYEVKFDISFFENFFFIFVVEFY